MEDLEDEGSSSSVLSPKPRLEALNSYDDEDQEDTSGASLTESHVPDLEPMLPDIDDDDFFSDRPAPRSANRVTSEV